MKFRWDKKYLYSGITAFVVIVASLTLLWLFTSWDTIQNGLRTVARVLSPVFYGLVIAYLLAPLCNFMERKAFNRLGSKVFSKSPHRAFVLSRSLSVTSAIFLALLLLTALLYMVLPQVLVSIQKMLDGAEGYISEIPQWISQVFDNKDLGQDVGHLWTAVYNGGVDWIKNSVLPQMETLIGGVFAGVVDVIRSLLNWIVGIVFAVYLLYGREKFAAQAKKILYSATPMSFANRLMKNLKLTHKMFGGFISAKILDSLIVGVLCYIFMLLFGLPYAPLIAVLIGVTNIIPVFGPFIGAIPSALIILLVDPWQCLWFLVFILVLQQVDGNLLGPKLMGTTTGLSGFWVMFALILGGGFFGFVGMLCGVPVFAVLYALIRTFCWKRLHQRALPEETADYRRLISIDEETHVPVYAPKEAEKPRRKPSKRSDKGSEQ